MDDMIWLLPFLSLFVAYFASDNLRRIRSAVLRRPALILLALLPLEVWIGWAWTDVCPIPYATGERCAGFGMGVVMLFPIYGAWAIAAVLGYFCGKRASLDRKA